MHIWGVTRAQGFLDGSDIKESAYNAGDQGSISGLGRSPGEGKGQRREYPLQYSCWENSMDRRACPSVTLWALTLRACNPMGYIPQGHRVGHD